MAESAGSKRASGAQAAAPRSKRKRAAASTAKKGGGASFVQRMVEKVCGEALECLEPRGERAQQLELAGAAPLLTVFNKTFKMPGQRRFSLEDVERFRAGLRRSMPNKRVDVEYRFSRRLCTVEVFAADSTNTVASFHLITRFVHATRAGKTGAATSSDAFVRFGDFALAPTLVVRSAPRRAADSAAAAGVSPSGCGPVTFVAEVASAQYTVTELVNYTSGLINVDTVAGVLGVKAWTADQQVVLLALRKRRDLPVQPVEITHAYDIGEKPVAAAELAAIDRKLHKQTNAAPMPWTRAPSGTLNGAGVVVEIPLEEVVGDVVVAGATGAQADEARGPAAARTASAQPNGALVAIDLALLHRKLQPEQR